MEILRRLGIDSAAPLYTLTAGQFVALLSGNEPKEEQQVKPYVYGLNGICRLFNVSKKTAQAWKNTWLSAACKQYGRTIIVDSVMAMELFDKRAEGRDSL